MHIPSKLALLLALVLTGCRAMEFDYNAYTFDPRSDSSKENQKKFKEATGPFGDATLSEGTRLSPSKQTYVLLQVDGGGILGITPAIILADLEKQLRNGRPGFKGKKLKELFSVCSGTSTGAILCGMVVAGVQANAIADYYGGHAPGQGVRLFESEAKNRFPLYPFWRPRYDRATFQKALYQVLEIESDLKEDTQRLEQLYSGPLLIMTAYDLSSQRTHFLRTRAENDLRLPEELGRVQLADAISYSALSAANYFGPVPARQVVWDHLAADGTTQKMRGAVYQDGGQATQNNTLALAALEAEARRLSDSPDNQVVIISLGCGNNFSKGNFEKDKSLSGFGQVFSFLAGNQARKESILIQWRGIRYLCAGRKNVHLFRYDWVPDRNYALDDAKYAKVFADAATSILQRKEYKNMVADLCRVKLAPTGPRPVGVSEQEVVPGPPSAPTRRVSRVPVGKMMQ